MRFRFIALSMVALLAVCSSCKKEEETTKVFMDGDITLSVPEFLHSGAILKFDVDTMSTLVRTDGDSTKIGYFFIDDYDSVMDTVRRSDGTVVIKEYTYSVPDTLATLTLSCTGFSDDHYNSSSSAEYTVIRDGLNGNASLTNFDIAASDSTFTDARDGKKYFYTTVGGVDWMRQNLAWEGAGRPYRNSPAVYDIFGGFYTHSEALSACPDGWTLPSEADWVKLAKDLGCSAEDGKIFPGISGKFMENIYFNGARMWEYWPDVKIDNSARFSSMPTGYAAISGSNYSYKEMGHYAMYWSSDKSGTLAAFRYIYEDKTGVYYGLLDPEYVAMSVRCIRK